MTLLSTQVCPASAFPEGATAYTSTACIGTAAMYILKPGVKQDQQRRWSLPDRVFFASGACHILAYAFLRRYPAAGFQAIWIKPAAGFAGHHVVAVRDNSAFDYHGYSRLDRLLRHTATKANRWWPGWNAIIVPLSADVLVSEKKSREYDGLWLREPEQFLHDALPRAGRFLDKFVAPTVACLRDNRSWPV